MDMEHLLRKINMNDPIKPDSAIPNDKFRALSYSREVDSNLKAILKDIESGDLASAKSTVLAIQKNFLGVQKYLSITITPDYYNQYRPNNSMIGLRVLAIPELFDAILQHLEVTDILRCYGVSRGFRNAIDSSSKLQKAMFLCPAPRDSTVRFPFNLRTFSFEHAGHIEDPYSIIPLRTSPWTTVIIRAERDHDWALPTIPVRWMQMLIRQPPVYEMSCNISCYPETLNGNSRWAAARANNLHRKALNIRSEEGLTVRDLYEAAKGLFEQHRDCGGWRRVDKRSVIFEEYFKNRDGEPLLQT